MATTNTTFKVSYKVTNLKADSDVKPLEREISHQTKDGKTKAGANLMQVIRWAVDHCFNTLQGNSQYPSGSKIEFTYNDITSVLTDAKAKAFKATEAKFNLMFDEIVNEVFSGFALKDDKLGEAFVRVTDKGGVFKSTKNITKKIVSAQIVASEKKAKEDRTWALEDGMSSVYGASGLVYRAKRQENTKNLREQVKKLLGK